VKIRRNESLPDSVRFPSLEHMREAIEELRKKRAEERAAHRLARAQRQEEGSAQCVLQDLARAPTRREAAPFPGVARARRGEESAHFLARGTGERRATGDVPQAPGPRRIGGAAASTAP
jgi:hypothetical protein